MTGVLQAPPTTPYDRLLAEGRIRDNSDATNHSLPNFRTAADRVLMGGLRRILLELRPERFYERAIRSLEYWQKSSDATRARAAALLAACDLGSMWHQGVMSDYRAAYWRFCSVMFWRWTRDRVKLWEASIVLLSAHHFVGFARHTAREIEQSVELAAPSTSDGIPRAWTAASGV